MAKKTTWNDTRIELLKRAADFADEHRAGRKLNWIYAAVLRDTVSQAFTIISCQGDKNKRKNVKKG